MSVDARGASFINLPAGIALPYYADPSQAWVQNITIPVNKGLGVIYTVRDGNLELPIFLNGNVVTNATVGNRLITLGAFTQTGFVQFLIASPIVQTATKQFEYNFIQGLSIAYGTAVASVPPADSAFVQIPLPPIVLFPGAQLIFEEQTSIGITTLNSDYSYSSIVIPTQGEQSDATAQPIPTAQLA